MAKIDNDYIQLFEGKLFEMFPDVKTTSTVSRKQIQTVMEKLKSSKYPTWLMQTKLGRGLYAIPGGSITAPIAGNTALAPQQPESVIVDYTNLDSLVPKIDGNYVPFGNYKDLEQIIVSKQFYPDRKSTRLNSSHIPLSRMPSSA